MEEEFAPASSSSAASEAPDNRPLEERLGDKNWKARNTAYEELRRLVATAMNEDPLFDEYASWLPKMVADANASAMDSGLDTATAFVDAAPPAVSRRYAEALCGSVVDKAFGTRAGTLAKGKALVTKLMEVDEPGPCVAILLSKLGDKKPKVPPTCLELIKEGIILFGARTFPIKDVIAALGPVLNGSNGPAREIALALMVELQRWIGKAPFNSLLDSVRSAQKTEFEKLCADAEAAGLGAPVPTLYLRKNRPAPGSEAASGTAAAKAAEPALDAREFVEEIDLAKKLRATDYSTLIVQEKWAEQAQGLQLVLDALGPTPKLKAGTDVGDIISECKGFLRQGHVQLQVNSLKIITLLADGMRSEFGPMIRPLTQSIIQKTKEKRLIPEVQAALVNIIKYCLSMEPLLEDIGEVVKSKKSPPHSRTCLMEFIASAIATCPEKISTDCLKPIADMLIASCEDSDPKVRDACSATLAALAPLVRSRGRNAVEAHRLLMGLEQSAPRIFKKMQASMEAASGAPAPATAVASAPAATAAATKSAPTAAPTSPRKPTTSTAASAPSSSAATAIKKPATATTSRPATASSSSASSSASAPAVKKAAPSKAASSSADDKEDDNVDDVAMGPEEAAAALAVLNIPNWDSSFQGLVDSAKWQEKVEAFTAIGDAIQAQSAGGAVSAALAAYLKAHTANFKISNISVAKAVMQLAVVAASNAGSAKFSKPAAWEFMKAFGDKFSDKKTQDISNSMLTAFCETVGPSFVVKRMRVVMDKIKAPVAHQLYLEWLKSAVAEFGAHLFPIQVVAAFCQLELDNKIAAVRTAAVEVMGALYHQIGPKFQTIAIADDIKPQLKALLEAEFAKVGHDPNAAKKASRSIKGEEGAEASVGALIPRQDLAAALDKNILSELNLTEGKTSWQNRKTAMDAIIAACEKSGHYLEASKGTIEIVKALKVRLNDTQANLKPIAAAAISHIISSVEVEQGVRILRAVAPALIAAVADNKKAMRDAAVATLQGIVTLNGTLTTADANLMGCLLTASGEGLANPVGRQELLAWIQSHVDGNGVRCDCNELAGPFIVSIQDKMAAVRTIAEQVLTSLISKGLINRNSMDKATRDLAPATKRALEGPINRMLASFGTRRVAVDEAAPAAAAAASAPVAEAPVPAPAPVAPSKPAPAPAAEQPVAAAPAPSRIARPPATAPAAVAAAPAIPAPSDEEAVSSADGSGSFKRTNKARRNEDFYKMNWPQPPEDVGETELATLRRDWEPFLSQDMIQLLFPHNKFGPPNQDTSINGIAELLNFIQHSGAMALMHSDFILRWSAYVLCLRETAQGLLKVLQLVSAVFELHRTLGAVLHDSEAAIIIPHLIERSGHKSERHKVAFKACIEASIGVFAPAKLSAYLLQGLGCKSKKTRVVCMEELEVIVAGNGYTFLGKSGLREIGAAIDSKDNDVAVRSAALDLVYAIYVHLGADQSKLLKLLGEMSDKSTTMIEQRIKERNRSAGGAVPVANNTAALPPAPSPERPQKAAAPVAAVAPVIAPVEAVPVARHAPVVTSSEEFSSMPFRLELTPPHEATNRTAAIERSPAVDNVKTSLFAKSPDAQVPSSFDAGSAYSEIAAKVNLMLNVRSTYASHSDISAAGKQSIANASDDCREYLKMLHSLVNNKWSSDQSAAPSAAEHKALLDNAERTCIMLLRCVSVSFDGAGWTERPESAVPVAAAIDVDISLVSVSLATLYDLLSQPGVVRDLSNVMLVDIIAETVLALSDEKLARGLASESSHVREASEQVQRVLLLIAAKIAEEAGTIRAVAAVVQALFQCIAEVNHATVGDCSVTRRALPKRCTKPLSKLLLRVLSDESSRSRPFDQPESEMAFLLKALHRFFSSHPTEPPSDDTPFCAAKTVLVQLVKHLGAASVLLTLQQVLGVPATSFICRLTAKLGGAEPIIETAAAHSQLGSDGLSESSSAAAQSSDDAASVPAVAPELHAQLVTIIDEITSSRDKMSPIRRLHALIKRNPSLDVSLYLQRISSVFRRFVLDTLQKLDREAAGEGSSSSSGSSALSRDENARAKTTKLPSFDSKLSSSSAASSAAAVALSSSSQQQYMSVDEEGVEAMRILQGLRANLDNGSASTSSSSSATNQRMSLSSADRAAIQSQVKGSLTSLTEALFADPTIIAPAPTAAPAVPVAAATISKPVTTTASSSSGGSSMDSDLAARIARLRNANAASASNQT